MDEREKRWSEGNQQKRDEFAEAKDTMLPAMALRYKSCSKGLDGAQRDCRLC